MNTFNNLPPFYITHLYPKQMNIYGDMGNIIAMKRRLSQIGLQPIYQVVNIGDELPSKTDWYFMGGGQDSDQSMIVEDLMSKKKKLFNDIASGVGLLAICGGYQLLGKKFLTGKGELLPGLGLFEVETIAPKGGVKTRCIGNVVSNYNIEGLESEMIVGFENHSGQTHLLPESEGQGGYPLATVVSGYGNNLNGKDEGYVLGNAVGTYMHGSCLPKNTPLLDWFIKAQLKRKGIEKDYSFDDTISKAVNTQLASLA